MTFTEPKLVCKECNQPTYDCYCNVNDLLQKHMKAISAIIELHKPFQFNNGLEEFKPVCQHCQLGVIGDVYPCETIYAIQKELQ